MVQNSMREMSGSSNGAILAASSSSPTRSDPLLITDGGHVEVENLNLLPYEHIKNLGSGGFGLVDQVRHTTTGKIYARKTIRLRLSQDHDGVLYSFWNEIEIMRHLSGHHHIVRCVASYICRPELGLILDHVADFGSLADLLQEIREGRQLVDVWRPILWRSFGCCAGALAFIHRKGIRHKDIKPENLLVHQGKIVFADFGVSLDGSDLESVTTTGIPDGFSRRYCPPEVVARTPGPRNTKSDVFSLGCVYTEITSTLKPTQLPTSLLKTCYAENIENILTRLNVAPSFVNLACSWMLKRENSLRATAHEIVSFFFMLERHLQIYKLLFACDECAALRVESPHPLPSVLDKLVQSFQGIFETELAVLRGKVPCPVNTM